MVRNQVDNDTLILPSVTGNLHFWTDLCKYRAEPARGTASKPRETPLSDADTILIVEDDLNFRRLLANQLSAEGYALELVDSVRNLKQQWENLASVDCMVLDVMLSDEEGYEHFRLLNREKFKGVPKVVVSVIREEGFNPPEEADIAYEEYIQKPCPVDKIVSTVNEIL